MLNPPLTWEEFFWKKNVLNKNNFPIFSAQMMANYHIKEKNWKQPVTLVSGGKEKLARVQRKVGCCYQGDKITKSILWAQYRAP